MTITLKKFKNLVYASEETVCFEAVVCFDGVPAFIATNTGRGGCNDYGPLPKQTRDQMRANVRLLEDHVKSLPPEVLAVGRSVPVDVELFLALLVDREILAKALQRKLKSSLLFTTTDRPGLFGIKAPASEAAFAQLRLKHKAAIILNSLPFEEALALYEKHG